MTYNIVDIQGIGTEFAEKLKGLNIHTTEDLLKHAPDERSIEALAEKTGISDKLFEKWTKMAGLMRVSGIGPQYAELLFFSGVEFGEGRDAPASGAGIAFSLVHAYREFGHCCRRKARQTEWS